MTYREAAFFIYGLGVGMKIEPRTGEAFDCLASWFLPGCSVFALLELAKAEVDPVLARNGAQMFPGLDFPGDVPQ